MYVAIRDGMLRHVDAEDGFAALQKLEVSSIEVPVDRQMEAGGFPRPGGGHYDLSTREGRRQMKEELQTKGVTVCALMMANRFSSGEPEEEIQWLARTMNAAAELGAEAVRIDMVPHGSDMTEQNFVSRCAYCVKKALETGSEGIALGVENHGKTTNREQFLDAVFARVKDPRFGLTLDTGNFYWYGRPLEETYRVIERFSPRVKHTHVKNVHYPADRRDTERPMGWKYRTYRSPIYDGDIDHGRIVSLLAKAGYNGDLTIEDESLHDFPEGERAAILNRDAEHLKRLAGET